MRFLIVGCGSIGQRHARNLRSLGCDDVLGYDPDQKLLSDVASNGLLTPVRTLEEAYMKKPDVVFVTNPTSMHLDTTRQAIAHGCDVFIEKPLSHTIDGLDALVDLADEKGVVSMVGCNMRFHPGPAKVKRLLDSGAIGRVTCARIQSGSYLPEWRPGQDYRKSYSAQSALGGGCILDGIHEIDLARWYVGDVKDVFSFAGHISGLEMDAEDTAEILLRFDSGAIGEVHLDYTQRAYQRSCEIIGDEGTILWDWNDGCVRRYQADTGRWAVHGQPPDWSINQMYCEELEHFLACVKSRQQTASPIAEAARVTAIALAARGSAQTETRKELR